MLSQGFEWLFLMAKYPATYKFYSLSEFKEEKNVRYLDNKDDDSKDDDNKDEAGTKSEEGGAAAGGTEGKEGGVSGDAAAVDSVMAEATEEAVKTEAVKIEEGKDVTEPGSAAKPAGWGDQDVLSP
jgi:hypothetical protein